MAFDIQSLPVIICKNANSFIVYDISRPQILSSLPMQPRFTSILARTSYEDSIAIATGEDGSLYLLKVNLQ